MSVFGRVAVPLKSRSYDIVVGSGLLADTGKLLKDVISRPRTAVVTDANVADLYLADIAKSMNDSHIAFSEIILPPGEQTKSFDGLMELADQLLSARIERGDTIIALGGGVVGDLTGFAASILRRGVQIVQMPTSLLAQVDASIGGKTGINTSHGKNLIGTFHQPGLVIADVDVLDTLPPREFLAGYAEVVKYGLLGDVKFFEWLEENGAAMIAGDIDARKYAVLSCARAKAEIVADDEMEMGHRALLNLGHTFGHAIEAELGYDGRIVHGEAVAIGMVMAFELSHRLDLCSADDVARVRSHLHGVGLPVAPPSDYNWDVTKFIDHMRQDKKVQNDALTFVLAKGIGHGVVARDVPESQVIQLLEAKLA
ncbi:MAG: 3-dehydroquinate synthase [Alphaproteobacteria bacterium]|jgi:3-dehydroquinate synthase|nr:3-dehydroquinate synthase [Alphaproteobacteria bacterium]MBT4711907.1 3-dehydroquinate synthase [Alphaproteobacteria bacterium]MBT5861015.1 3-dehydroquinate synthase [Alphaproteobacteria bacterium]